MKSDELKLYTNCIPVKGYLRSVIQDIQRSSFSFVPNSLIDCISESKFVKKHEYVDEESFNNYREFLISEDYVFAWEMSLTERFPDYKAVFYQSYHIYSLHFIEVRELSIVKKMLLFIEQGLIVKHLVFVIEECRIELLEQLIDLLNNQLTHTSIESVQFRFKKDFGVQNYFLSKSNIDYRINLVEIVSLESKKRKKANCDHLQIHSINERNPKMVNNFLHYFESVQFHTYFNGKFFVNPQGILSHQPEEFNPKYSITNLKSKQDVLDLLQLESFNEFSKVRKEDTVICKSCELRHMCLDERLPKKNSTGDWYHIVECDYNPFIGKWKKESGYRTLEECGVYSNENGIIIDNVRISQINQELWKE
jgi:radical SAM protein with 4Fe4S-binding SPASM domain